MTRLKQFFLAGLFVNGVGSCALAIAYPYFLLRSDHSATSVFQIQALIFLAAAIGLLVWGKILDASRNIWRLKLIVVLMEVVASIAFVLGVHLDASTETNGVAIAILEFLFAFEIPWSRLAYLKLPTDSNQTTTESAREISLTANLISLVAPAIGAGLGTFSVEKMAAINILTTLPYIAICLYLWGHHRGDALSKAIERAPARLGDFFMTHKSWRRLFIGYSIMTITPAVMMSSLPIILNNSLGNTNEIIAFYLISGLIMVLSGTKVARRFIQPALTGRFSILSTGLLAGTILFLAGHGLVAKIVGYSLHNVFWIALSIDLTGALYRPVVDQIRGRLFSLFQLSGKFSFPAIAGLLSLFAGQSYLLGSVGLSCVSVAIGGVLMAKSVFNQNKDSQGGLET